MKPLLAILYFFIPCIKDHICTQLRGSREGQLSNNALVIIYSVLMVLSNMKTYIFHIFQVPPPPHPADNVSQRQKESILSLNSEVRRYSHRGSEFRQRGYIYNGGSVVLKCSANYHLCIFSHGLRGLWVLWAVCQR